MSNARPPSTGTPIFLLKTRTNPDGYEEYFFNHPTGKWRPAFVPVLEHRFLKNSLSQLSSWVENGAFNPGGPSAGETYTGLIFTSQRAVEAFAKVITNLRATNPDALKQLSSDTPLYVVGPATARGLRALNLPCPILGEESGNGNALADFILDHCNKTYAERQQGRKTSLVFLVGEQHRDIIPKKLARGYGETGEGSIAVKEIVTYETSVMESFPAHFGSLVRPNLEQDLEQWVVVFSPTGCKAMLEVLGVLDQETGKAREENLEERRRRKTKIATIGPTTRDYLITEFGFEPDVCAGKPSPQGLGAVIEEFEVDQNTVASG